MSDSEEDWEEEEQEQEWGKAVKQSDSDWVDGGKLRRDFSGVCGQCKS